MLKYICLIIGFVLLIKGADFFVDGSSAIAKRLHVPTIIIGLTIVAFGTSMPEASVSIAASIAGKNSLAISNVIGSNLFNLLIVLGVAALFQPIKAHKEVIKSQFPMSIMLACVLEIGLCFNLVFNDSSNPVPTLDRIGALILLIIFIFFMYKTIKDTLKARKASLSVPGSEKHIEEGEALKELVNEDIEESEKSEKMPIWKIIVFVIGGVAAIIIGGDLVVDSASDIARTFGLSETLIGLTIVALGTSLPELVTSVVAAKKGENDLALGNVIGSNIFNIGFILGASALISPLSVAPVAIFDTLILIISSIIALAFTFKGKDINKKEGFTLVIIYAIYFVYITLR